MTLTLHVPPDLEERLVQEARRQGITVNAFALALLDKAFPVRGRNTELLALIEEWIEQGDSEEQRDTGEYLVRALDEDRNSHRPLFPPELKDVTW